MMDSIPTHWLSLVGMACLLGLKHGLDPDHIAAIDGLTRANAARKPRWSRWSGLLFSAGHGGVVTAVAVAAATASAGWRAPAWLDQAGALISIAFLALLGAANLLAVVRTPRGQVVRVAGIRGRFFMRLTRAGHPAVIVAVGAAFALSLDTLGHAVLFSVTGSPVGGWLLAGTLGLAFTAGMVTTDTLNGLWVSRLLRAADGRAAAASRIMSLSIAAVSLWIAALAAARQLLPGLEARLEGWGAGLGAAVACAIAAAYAAAMRIAPRDAAAG